MAEHTAFLLRQYHHITLPRDVPGQEDPHIHDIDAALLDHIIKAVRTVASHAPLLQRPAVNDIRLTLTASRALNVDGKVDKNVLAKEINDVKGGQALILYIFEQNSGILIYSDPGDSGDPCLVFEAFEASAISERVLAATSALQWNFPTSAAKVPVKVCREPSFQKPFAAFIEQASIESVKHFAAITYKAAAPMPEIRDTTDPSLITGFLITTLQAIGARAEVPILHKRVRDTVCFENASKPWRRTPFYLIIRAAMQRRLYSLMDTENGNLYYKLIMAEFMTGWLEHNYQFIPDEAAFFLMQKIGRRLAKIEQSGPFDKASLFSSLESRFETSLKSVKAYLERRWVECQVRNLRCIHPVSTRAQPHDLDLSLPSSREALRKIVLGNFEHVPARLSSTSDLLEKYESSKAQAKSFAATADRYLKLARKAEQICNDMEKLRAGEWADVCCSSAQSIRSYMLTAGPTFDGYPELKSRYILDIMELWVKSDRNATLGFPLLKSYHPGLLPDMLDSLELLYIEDMRRVQEVQEYLRHRCRDCTGSRSTTIFAPPSEHSFAVVFYDTLGDSLGLKMLREQIEFDAKIAYAKKEEEWRDSSRKHEQFMKDIAGTDCEYVEETLEDGTKEMVHKKGCTKHVLKWKAKQLKIEIHEHPLPKNETAIKAAIFELKCPQPFAAYRDATWLLISKLVHRPTKDCEKRPTIRGYSQLLRYIHSCRTQVTLGSSKKSHLDCHYARTGFPVELRDVCRPCGLDFDYYDTASQTWTKRSDYPSLYGEFPLLLPQRSPYLALDISDGKWPTSNEAIASQVGCPPQLSAHEYMAWQGLLVGKHIRWLSLLRELGATNVNFSTESTRVILSRLILQIGASTTGHRLRDFHAVFDDDAFCEKLLELIGHRLGVIQRNWRESIQMDILITMTLKIISLSASQKVQSEASELLCEARKITWDWCNTLQSSNMSTSHELAALTIWASVLCKRTFHRPEGSKIELDSMSAQCYIGASIVLSENLVDQFDGLPCSLRNLILQDLFFAFHNREVLAEALAMDRDALLPALNHIALLPPGSSHKAQIKRVHETQWIEVFVGSTGRNSSYLCHYNVVHGYLLINGHPSGVLPVDYHKPMVHMLFETYALRVRPSYLPGMTLVIVNRSPEHYSVHLGFRGSDLVVKAERNGAIYELVPRAIFYGRPGVIPSSDLPADLIENCYHWLNLNTKVLEIRQTLWKTKLNDWKLNLDTKRATKKNLTLLDPSSTIAMTVYQNFMYFEKDRHIMVTQSDAGRVHRIHVHLKRLGLTFVVNHRQHLQCFELDAEIADTRTQDIGTWHGLRSKIVLRSVKNPMQRLVLVPEGQIRTKRRNNHVIVEVVPEGIYHKFDIDEVLGRICCPAEPRLLYAKAQWHAYTSHFLPDPLTKQTGSEEALSLLHSGLYKHWAPLEEKAADILIRISGLSPHREYYPSSLKHMERVHWNPNLSTSVQDDRYRTTIDEILRRSAQLRRFYASSEKHTNITSADEMHLAFRSMSRSYTDVSFSDTTYVSRGYKAVFVERDRVAAIARALAVWSIGTAQATSTQCLTRLLGNKSSIIGGLDGNFDLIQISDLISIDVVHNWGSLMNTCLQATSDDRIHLMFMLGPMVLSSSTSMDLMKVLISCAVVTRLKEIDRPSWSSYSWFIPNEIPSARNLACMMKPAYQPLQTPPFRTKRRADAQEQHDDACERSCEILAKAICKQWPRMDINAETLPGMDPNLLDSAMAFELVQVEWKRLVQNFEFWKFLQKTQECLDNIVVEADEVSLPELEPPKETVIYRRRARQEFPTLQSLLSKSTCPDILDSREEVFDTELTSKPCVPRWQLSKGHAEPSDRTTQDLGTRNDQLREPHYMEELSEIIEGIRHSDSTVRQDYGLELQQSFTALRERISQPSPQLAPLNPLNLRKDIQRTALICNATFDNICKTLKKGDSCARWLQLGYVWPRMNRGLLLSSLRSTSDVTLGQDIKKDLVDFGVLVTSLQRMMRIEDYSLKGRAQQLHEERINQGHTNWDPFKETDWLLLEIDNNMMIRSKQVDVACATISPETNVNSVTQLLMGAGKTSCVLPMVAAKLADKQQLLRIVIPRPLLLQTAQVMQVKLGGFLDREILHIPFSRRTKPDGELLKTFRQLHSRVKNYGGILLSLPESILSFKLSGLQHLCDGATQKAQIMIQMQDWLNQHTRDVLDESDVSLAIRTQLIYPSGSQTAVDGHPLRWQTIQTVLGLLRTHLTELERKFPRSVEIVRRPVGDFPIIYLLRKDAQDHLVSMIVDDVCNGQLAALQCPDMLHYNQDDIRTLISQEKVTPEVVSHVVTAFKNKQHMLKTMYLLRGLFVHRIFLSSLKKRWNVQYGIHPNRDPIAVPYQAKGVPSPTSEWGHPDVALILTCLSFYYQGLSVDQLRQAFEQLLKSDEPSIEYEKWATKTLPGSLRNYDSINVEDNLQLSELHSHICFNVHALNFFMNNFVFPRHARQFATKLQASGWDLVQYNPTVESRARTTGFSGTNDSRHQLPMTIEQNDLVDLAHTNAEVLSYFLQPRNRLYVRMIDTRGRRLSEEGLLKKLLGATDRFNKYEGIRILIDAGAQILEHDNLSLVKAWLKIDYEAKAAVYFDSDHRPWVVYQRLQKTIPLLASPFAENLEECLVYLDESHCRGTDLKLPSHARAALTLGPHVTKDGISQAAMRLRLLGQSQAITFFSPPEVHQSILDLLGKPENYKVDSPDVISWLLQQSCNAIEQLEPLYYNQGISFLQQEQAKIRHPLYLFNVHQRTEYLSVIRSKESLDLKQMYEPKRPKKGSVYGRIINTNLQAFLVALNNRKKGFQDCGIATHSSTLEEVEQEREREVEHEVENVRELEKPIRVHGHEIRSLHRDIESFVKTGKLIPDSAAYQPMFAALQRTACGKKHGPFTFSQRSDLLVSTEFVRTVKTKTKEANDTFLRPCHWILWNPSSGKALVVSPEEADVLVPRLRVSRGSRTHLIVFSAPLTRRMLHFNDLNYYALPTLPPKTVVPITLKIELGIFCGKLYFEWDEYIHLLAYLGVKMDAEGNRILEDPAGESFVDKPFAFLHEWVSLLRKGQDFEQTPMGFVTTGKTLSENHPFFVGGAAEEEPDKEARLGVVAAPEAQEDEESDDEGDDDDFHDVDEHTLVDEEAFEDDTKEREKTFFDASSASSSDEEKVGSE